MVVVVVCNEFSPVDQTKAHAESRMKRGRTDVRFRQALEPARQTLTAFAECSQQVGDGNFTVVRVLGPWVCKAGRTEVSPVPGELAGTAHVGSARVKQGAQMLLYSPSARWSYLQCLFMYAGPQRVGTNRCPPEPL